MSDRNLTLERIDDLLRFLPLLKQPGRGFSSMPSQPRKDGDAFVIMHPLYGSDVLGFFHTAGEDWWADYQYLEHPARKRLDDAEFVSRASIDEIRTMLIMCVRGERFCDGFWESLLQSGTVVRLLERLAELRSSFE